ncbi:MAG: sensor histidine kinase [Gammaproteobacteria bacterium]|uniref:sensor histidine kinase n=1 Tax=Rhodoferax sp. TaxID=50421 RepID=UPI0017F0ED4F|nr:sensor histidine kinase [Rhodoferax sp.]MBU3898114.1 sensor histidine kinase [Gammaproteobacteria bacterium]MBA3058604.1 sensor histidine kinase [Rhodoferax sp.]MBU3999129.1 sensor histidine kinase [Gammaproteobacteria bacterium]MBU4081692.1 sensor histidine kinase [Gammaproteobacteria bacterium]MBU4113550.1 sensor histidine kinase [Gammaproteobacteria bacterium]
MNWVSLRGSLRVRLLFGTLFWIAASIVVAGWGLSSLFRQHVQTQFQAELTSHLDQLTAQLTVDARNAPVLQLALSDPRLMRPFSGYYWQIDRMAGGADAVGVLRSRSLWDHVLVLPPPVTAKGDSSHVHIAGPQGQWLNAVQRTVQLDETPGQAPVTFRLMAAANDRFMLEPVAQFGGTMWLALAVLALGLVVAAAVQVWVGLAPLRALRRALGQVHSGQAQRLDGEFPIEVKPLIDDFNQVLAQNADVVTRARTHAGNLAHALKTPLSVLANAAQQPGNDTAALAHLVGEQVEIARKQVNYHLTRAQAAAASRLHGTKTDVLPVVLGLVRVVQRIHAERALCVQLGSVAAEIAFRGEAQDLQEMLGNLLDNACKWAQHRVDVNAHVQGHGLVITIDDDGPGLAPAQREVVLQRGVRADEQVPGSGLGLAIVDDLARLYGGSVALSASPAGGLRAVLALPAAHHRVV